MVRLSLSEIRNNAIEFAAEWKDASSERAEAQSFWQDFFKVFGIQRRSVASFEEPVKNLGGAFDRIDVFYKGKMLGEHKSRGQDLSKAASQAFNYVQSLEREERGDEAPRYIVISDFALFVIYDLESEKPTQPIATVATSQLYQNIQHFGFLSGYETRSLEPEDEINVRAVEVLGALHDGLAEGGFEGHDLERFLVRVLFCLFAEDTGIFDPNAFRIIVENSKSDGGDLGPNLAQMFSVLNKPQSKRQTRLPEELKALPWVNGELFHEKLDFAAFDGPMRKALIKCCNFDWSRISPAVFGSLFQSIMSDEAGSKKRREVGAHYTSERDILKVINSLFLDKLKEELDKCGKVTRKLNAFHDKLASLKFLDPACGCGNFLVVTYRELRLLELKVLKRLHGSSKDRMQLFSAALLRIDVDQMYGIEIVEWPARIAEVAMWLIDHQMNLLASEYFGKSVVRLPLEKGAKIRIENALQFDWNELLSNKECSYVLGNPPFVGAKFQTKEQKEDMKSVFDGVKKAGLLDYVAAWYLVASNYIKDTQIACAFVSTNSITQGEQVGVLWPALFDTGINIQFAHSTFNWFSEARGKAHVHVVIVGFGLGNPKKKALFEYEEGRDKPSSIEVDNIGPYLTPGSNVAVTNRSKPLCGVPKIGIGNKPIDGGHYLFSKQEMNDFVSKEPESKKYFRQWLGARELLHGEERYCLWLGETTSSETSHLKHVKMRIKLVKDYRSDSKSKPTNKLADTPTRFHVENMPTSKFLAIPGVSSERRQYIPIAYLNKNQLASNLLNIVPDATIFHFGVLTSAMHMAWVRQVCGRLESRYRYSNKLVYNNFPWPEKPTPARIKSVEKAAQGVLDARKQFKGETLADLYHYLLMPKELVVAHRKLNTAVDRCYRSQPFNSDRKRIEYLFAIYTKLVEAEQN